MQQPVAQNDPNSQTANENAMAQEEAYLEQQAASLAEVKRRRKE